MFLLLCYEMTASRITRALMDESDFPCRYHSTMALLAHISPDRWTVCSLVAAVQRHSHPIDMINNNMSSISYVNQYHCITMRIGRVVAFWSRRPQVMRSNPRQVSFPLSIIYNHTSLYCPVGSGATVDPTSQIYSSAMLILPIVGNWKCDFGVEPSGIKSIQNFIQIRPGVLELKHADRRTDRKTWQAPYIMRLFHAHRAKTA
jgi:hypothetical protein